MAELSEKKLVRLSGLWPRRKKNGQEYYCGSISETCNVYLFEGKETGSNKPRYVLYLGRTAVDPAEAERQERPWDAED